MFKKGQSGNPKGRPKKSDKFEGQISKSEKQIADRLPALIDNMMTLAFGVTVQEVDPKSGETVVYTKPPDFKANEYLINRIMGKPTERAEVSGPDGAPVQVEMMNRALAKAYDEPN